jgi:esterase/lipase superfamily enzyme
VRKVRLYYFGPPERVTKGARLTAKRGSLAGGVAVVELQRGFNIQTRDGIIIRSMRPLKEVKAVPKPANGENVLIFIHGFCRGFEESIQRAAQLAHTYDYHGTIIVFSWPSLGRPGPLSYLADRKALDGSGKVFEKFLRAAVKEFGASRIQIIAHSLGCRLACTTLTKLARPKAPFRLKNILLVAPDVDAKQFRDRFAKPVAASAKRTTVYYSRSDKMLALAGVINKQERLGRIGPGKIDGIERVDFTPLGGLLRKTHNDYRAHPNLVWDIRGVLSGKLWECDRTYKSR